MLQSMFAQEMNPKEYATITQEILSGEKSRIAPTIDLESTAFTPNGDFLFIVDGQYETDGNVVVYDVTQKKVVKKFKIKKTGLYSFKGKIIYNPNNTNQLALVLNKSTVKVIQNWQTAPEDILLQKMNENVVSIKAKVDKGQMAFSKDGKSLFLIENEATIIKSVDLASGLITKKILPDGKLPRINYNFSTFIGNDEIVVYNNSINEKKKPSIPHNIEIFNLTTNLFVRKYELEGIFDFPNASSYGNPHLIKTGDMILNVLTGEKDETYKKIEKAIKAIDKSATLGLHKIPDIGFVGSYFSYKRLETKSGNTTTIKTTSGQGLFFYDKDGNEVYGNFPSVNNKVPITFPQCFQISPNGKYIIFKHNDNDDPYNSRLVIATLY
jgi:WD40 repeat protein